MSGVSICFHGPRFPRFPTLLREEARSPSHIPPLAPPPAKSPTRPLPARLTRRSRVVDFANHRAPQPGALRAGWGFRGSPRRAAADPAACFQLRTVVI